MEPERWLRLRTLFEEARDMAAEARARFLDRELASDPDLREQLEALLRAQDASGEFLHPAQRSGSGERTASEDLPELPGATVGPYRLLRVLGEGGFGVVYVAEQTVPIHRQVAVKILKRGFDTRQITSRFRAEIQALALMEHPNIARIHDAGETAGGRPYLVMEIVPGVPITEFCDSERLSVRERCALFLQVGDAVQHAHQKGVIHRDLKPSNVLVVRQDGRPQVKIIDFGGVRAMRPQLFDNMHTREGTILGTLGYMSPEQTAPGGAAVDTRSDIYSLGIVLYELLAGDLPFHGLRSRSGDWLESLRLIREGDAPKLTARYSSLRETAGQVAQRRSTDRRGLARQLRGELEWITLRAIDKEPDRRYASVSEFSADLRRYLREEPVLAGPPSTVYRLRKFARRHRLGVATGVAVMAALLAGAVGTGIGLQRARRAERAQRRAAESARSVADFLTGIFETPTPDRSLGETVTARTLLAQGARQIEGGLKEDPQVRARLLNTLGRAHLKLGLTDEGLGLVRRSLAIDQALLKPDDPVVALDLVDLADALREAGRLDSVAPVIDRSIEIYRKLGSAHASDLASAWHEKALFFWDRGRLREADSLVSRAIALGESVDHPDTSEMASLYNSRGGIARRREHPEEAVKYFSRALDLAVKSRGEEQTLVAVLHRNLAVQYLDLHDPARAIPQAEDAVRIARKILSPDHPYLAGVLGAQARVLKYQKQWDAAAALMEESLRILRKSYGPDHPEVVWQLFSLGTLYERSGRFDLAITNMREACAAAARNWGNENDQTAECMADLASLFAEAGQARRADSLFSIAIPIVERVSSARPNFQADAFMSYADVCCQAGRFGQADLLYCKAESLFDSSNAAYRPYFGACLVGHALLLAREGRADRAVAMARTGLAAQEKDSSDAAGLAGSLLKSAAVHVRARDESGALALLEEARRRGAGEAEASRYDELARLRKSVRAGDRVEAR